jgi:hypothetical protein
MQGRLQGLREEKQMTILEAIQDYGPAVLGFGLFVLGYVWGRMDKVNK